MILEEEGESHDGKKKSSRICGISGIFKRESLFEEEGTSERKKRRRREDSVG